MPKPRKPKKPTTAPPADDIELARREAAELLGIPYDKLTASDRLKCELIAALRTAIDDELGNVTSARAPDLARLIVAVEALTKFLVDAKPKENEQNSVFRRDPYQVLDELAERWRQADQATRRDQGLSPRISDLEGAQARIDDLEAELVRLRGPQPHALPAPEAERTIMPKDGDVVPPSEQSDNPANMRAPIGTAPKQPTVIEGKPLRPGMGPDGKPIPPQAKSGAETEAQRQRVNSDRSLFHKVMNAPSRVSHEPTPSSPMTTYGDGNSSFYWDGPTGRGRAW